MTWPETSAYLDMFPDRNTPCGQSLPAVLDGIALWTPNSLASSDPLVAATEALYLQQGLQLGGVHRARLGLGGRPLRRGPGPGQAGREAEVLDELAPHLLAGVPVVGGDPRRVPLDAVKNAPVDDSDRYRVGANAVAPLLPCEPTNDAFNCGFWCDG